jgi:hypothetical protein
MPVSSADRVLFAGMPECNCSSLSSTAAQGRVLHENALLLTFGASKVRRFAIQAQEKSATAICAMALFS